MNNLSEEQLVIAVDDGAFMVERVEDVKNLKPEIGKGYIINDLVYICRDLKDLELDLPGIYIKEDGRLKKVEPSKSEKEKYGVDKCNDTSRSAILKSIEKNMETMIPVEDLEKINNNSSIFRPVIKEEDDFLKKIIKMITLDKEINLQNYKGKCVNSWTLNNMRMGLNGTTSMSVNYFIKWLELYGVEATITLKDNGTDKLKPLKEPIVVTIGDF